MEVNKKPAIIHSKKLFGGRETAQEVHAKHAFPLDAKCAGCKRGHGKLQSVARVLWPLDELKKRDPIADAAMQANPTSFLKLLVQTIHGPHVRLATVYCCSDKDCQAAFSRALAKQPSWVIIDRNDGPGADKIVSAAR